MGMFVLHAHFALFASPTCFVLSAVSQKRGMGKKLKDWKKEEEFKDLDPFLETKHKGAIKAEENAT